MVQVTKKDSLNASNSVNEAARAPSKGREEIMAGPDDLDLVARVQKGDKAAFRTLFDRYHRRAYSVALGVVKDPQAASDVVQDTFVKVWKAIESFEGTSSFFTWLYRILMNVAIDHVRKSKKGSVVAFDERVERESEADEGDGGMVPKWTDINPGQVLSRKELAQKMEAALATLPEHHRAVILMRELDGLSYDEMAEIQGVPKGTIMSRLFHARKKMQIALTGYVDGDIRPTDENGEE